MSLAVPGPTDTLSKRSELVVSLRSQMFVLPGLWVDVGKALEVSTKLLVDQGETARDDEVWTEL